MHDWPDAWLSEDPLPADPFPIAVRWLEEAFAERLQPNPHAIALATVGADGRPDVRMVLCKALEPEAGALVFYTDRRSPKGEALRTASQAAAVFYFGHADRQLRLAGSVEETTPAESDAYFASRPLDSRIGAWASAQSAPAPSRAALEAAYEREAERFGVRDGATDASVPRPPYWGGYRLRAERVELWHGRPGRLHDRALWTRTLPRGAWRVQRLQP